MSFADPFWLILLIPLGLAVWQWRLPSRLLRALRGAALLAVLLALAGLHVRLPLRSGTVILVADQSLSMPPGSQEVQKEAADIIHAAMTAGDKLAVVSFAEKAAVERSPQSGKFDAFTAAVGRDASNLADGLDKALALVPPGDPARILVLSDGRWTGRDLSEAVARASALGVAIDYRPIQNPAAGDLAIRRIQAPDTVLPGQAFMLAAWVDSPLGGPVSYELFRGSQRIAAGRQTLTPGSNRLVFRDKAGDRGGACEYTLRVVSQQGDDPVPGNNAARTLLGIQGPRPILCVGPARPTRLPGLLADGGLKIEYREAARCRWTLAELAGYAAVLLENTPAAQVGHVGMENLAAWVARAGGGLMLTGGKNAYGPGGYYKSPLEPVLPVSMELRREHRKLAIAIVVALDRSGSMAMPVPGGRTKIDLADLATAEVLEMLSPLDQFGCIAVDSIAHEIVPLSPAEKKGPMRRKILAIDSAGGGIFVYEALQHAAAMIAPAEAGAKHIILFADANDSEEPGQYKTLLDRCAKAGITVSVVGLGTERDKDAELLKDIARRGGGQCMFTENAHELPRLFAQDTLLVARSAFIDEPVAVRAAGALRSIVQQPLGALPGVGGYNLCYQRPQAMLGAATEDEQHAPVVAAWQAGLGRALCYTGEADGQYTGAMGRWDNAGRFFNSLALWTSGAGQGLAPGVAATQEVRDGVCRVELHLDPERWLKDDNSAALTRLPEVATLRAVPGQSPRGSDAARTPMRWSSPDTLLAEIPIAGAETVINTVEVAGLGHVSLAPACLPYSPELAPETPGQGTAAFERLARPTGGRERVKLADIWNDVPRKPQRVALAPYLLLAATGLFLAEVFQRRTGLLGVRWGRGIVAGLRGAEQAASRLASRIRPVRRKKARPAGDAAIAEPPPAATAEPAPQPEPSPSQPAEAPGVADALSQARQQARSRTRRPGP